MHKLLLLEKNIYFRDTWRRILHGRFPDVVIREVGTFDECIAQTEAFRPDLLILNLSYLNSYNSSWLRQVRNNCPTAVIMLLMDYDIDEYRKDAILNGANYLISKDLWTGNEILALINTTLSADTKKVRAFPLPESVMTDEESLKSLFERRDKSQLGSKVEKKFLARNLDRRRESNS